MEQIFKKNSCIDLVTKLEPFYFKLNSKYSKSYLLGSDWYIGDSLINWWNKESLNILNFKKLRIQLIHILKIILINEKITNQYMNNPHYYTFGHLK